MRIVLATLTSVIALTLALPAHGQKLYRWVDENGNVHYSDSLPPEAVDQARRELSKTSGTTTAQIDRALTAEERAAAQAEAEREAVIAAEAELRRQYDQRLLQSYPNESDLTRAFNDRLKMLDEAITSADVGIESQQYVLASLLNDAADRELAGERVPLTVEEAARDAQAKQQQLYALQQQREAERAAIEQDYEEALERYRLLVAEREGGQPEEQPSPATGSAADGSTSDHDATDTDPGEQPLVGDSGG